MLTDYELPFRDLIDAAPDGLIVCDEHGLIRLLNAEAERMFGYSRDELIGKPIDTLVPDSVRAHHAHHLSGYTAAPRLRPMGSALDLHGRRKDGSEFPVEISLSPIRSPRGLLITAGIRDMTDRRRLERENRRAKDNLMSAVEAVQEAFTLFDEHDRVTIVNSTARQLLDGGGDAMVGRRFEDVLRDALANGVFDYSNETQESLYRRWLDYHHNPSGTLEVRTGTGRYLRVTERKTAGHGTVSTIADITDDVQRAEELSHAREAAEAASAAKSEFLSSMSHELRTPLNAILGFAQLLERDRKRPLDERQLERLGHVLRGGEHLLRLIDDILDLARIEAGRVAISTEPVIVDDVLREVASTLHPMASAAQIALTVLPLEELPSVSADRTRLAQVLMNFGSNAIKYGRAGGSVTFRAESIGRSVRITVRDDGIGIPADKRDKIFEPFQRAGQETGAIQGTGIGLTISKRLAEMMDATVDFTSEAGQGSEFWIDLQVPQIVPPHAAEGRVLADTLSPLFTASDDTRRLRRRQPVEHRVHARPPGRISERRAADGADRRDRVTADPRSPARRRDHGYQPTGNERPGSRSATS